MATCRQRIIKPELQFLSDDSADYVSDSLVIHLFFSQLLDEKDDSDDEEFLPGISPGKIAAVDSQVSKTDLELLLECWISYHMMDSLLKTMGLTLKTAGGAGLATDNG